MYWLLEEDLEKAGLMAAEGLKQRRSSPHVTVDSYNMQIPTVYQCITALNTSGS